MNQENKDYSIFIRSTGERVPVTKEEFAAYYHDIDSFRKKQQRHGRCACPQSKSLYCDMDCYACSFHRAGDEASLDYETENEDGDMQAWVDQLPDDAPLFEEIIADAAEARSLYHRLTELMPEALEIGRLRLDGLSEDAISERIGIGRKTYAYRLKKVKAVLQEEFPDFF